MVVARAVKAGWRTAVLLDQIRISSADWWKRSGIPGVKPKASFPPGARHILAIYGGHAETGRAGNNQCEEVAVSQERK
ncbi:hypothetical protein KCP73_14420 [Salmonella enterica subsp. enterica]|nr:hypothetical protein KCP73_14420 [Salmonella enterica subsp. enterica]